MRWPRAMAKARAPPQHGWQAGDLSRGHPRGPVRGDGARSRRLLHGRGHRRVRRRVQGHRGLLEQFGEARVIDTPISEAGVRRRGGGRGAHGHAAGGGDAVHRLHRPAPTTCSPTTSRRRAIAPASRADGGARARAAACAAGRSTRRTPRRLSFTRRGSRSSTRPRRATPRA